MKPGLLLTVILAATGMLFTGVSCNTSEKAAPTNCYMPEIPVKEEEKVSSASSAPSATLSPSAKAAYRQGAAPKTNSYKLIKHHYNKMKVKGDTAPYCGVAQWTEVDMSDSVRTCNLAIEAEFPGGAAAWQRFLNKNLRYPEELFESGELQSTAVVQFVVDKYGNISEVEAISGSEALRAEVVRVIKRSGRWTPAVQNGQPVKSLKKQPFVICIRTDEM